METRPSDLDHEILDALVRAGFTSLLMGIESGSEKVLGKINKSSGPTHGAMAIKRCRCHGIEPEIGFLMFVPDSNLSDLRKNMDFLMENNLLDRIERTANLLCHCQIVLKGTASYTEFEKAGRLVNKGLFGFEAEVTFMDDGVKKMSILIMHACHQILRRMGNPDSPIHFAREETETGKAANQYLVNLFLRLLEKMETGKIQNNMDELKTRIDGEIAIILDN